MCKYRSHNKFPLFASPSCRRRYAPIGILFLIAGKIVEMDDLTQMGGQLGMYTITVIIGLLIHGMIILPTLYFAITRQNPFIFIAGLLQALVTALGTSSRWAFFMEILRFKNQLLPFRSPASRNIIIINILLISKYYVFISSARKDSRF